MLDLFNTMKLAEHIKYLIYNIVWWNQTILTTFKKFLSSADGGKYIAALSAKVCLEQEEAYYTSPAFNGSSTARDQVGALIKKILSETTNDVDKMIKDAFAAAVDECEYQE